MLTAPNVNILFRSITEEGIKEETVTLPYENTILKFLFLERVETIVSVRERPTDEICGHRLVEVCNFLQYLPLLPGWGGALPTIGHSVAAIMAVCLRLTVIT